MLYDGIHPMGFNFCPRDQHPRFVKPFEPWAVPKVSACERGSQWVWHQWSSLSWTVFDGFWAAFSICIFRSQIPLLTWTQRMSSCILEIFLEFPKVLCLKTSHAQEQAALSSAASWPTCNGSCYGQSNLLDCERWIHVLEAIVATFSEQPMQTCQAGMLHLSVVGYGWLWQVDLNFRARNIRYEIPAILTHTHDAHTPRGMGGCTICITHVYTRLYNIITLSIYTFHIFPKLSGMPLGVLLSSGKVVKAVNDMSRPWSSGVLFASFTCAAWRS